MEALMPVARQSQCTPRGSRVPRAGKGSSEHGPAHPLTLDFCPLEFVEIGSCGSWKLIQITKTDWQNECLWMTKEPPSSVMGDLVRMGHKKGILPFHLEKGTAEVQRQIRMRAAQSAVVGSVNTF